MKQLTTTKQQQINPFIMSINIINIEGKPAIQFRKIITFCDKNKDFVNELINASFNDTPITAPVLIQFNDRLKARNVLKELGYNIDLKKGF